MKVYIVIGTDRYGIGDNHDTIDEISIIEIFANKESAETEAKKNENQYEKVIIEEYEVKE